MNNKAFLGTDNTVYFSDFDFDFSPHPMTGDINVLKNDLSIKNSIRNLIQTNYGEILFDSTIGCGLKSSLFDPMDDITKYSMQRDIESTLKIHEPRVSISAISITEDDINHGYYIIIDYTIINNNTGQTVKIFLKRIR